MKNNAKTLFTSLLILLFGGNGVILQAQIRKACFCERFTSFSYGFAAKKVLLILLD